MDDELTSRLLVGAMVALDLVDQAAHDAVEHGQGNVEAAREWLAARLLALPSDDPTAAACRLVAWSDVFDLFATGPRAAYLRYLPSAADPAGLNQAELGDLVASRALQSAARCLTAAIKEAEASKEISPN
jgi:hypothetical protein